MPKELLNISPLYSLVGVYRLITDEKVRNPIWLAISFVIYTVDEI